MARLAAFDEHRADVGLETFEAARIVGACSSAPRRHGHEEHTPHDDSSRRCVRHSTPPVVGQRRYTAPSYPADGRAEADETPEPATVRIVSLLPSATEIVCEIGLADRLVGVSHECDHPPRVRDLPRLTRAFVPADAPSAAIDALVRSRLHDRQPLYALDAGLLERLRPDLVVTQALCDVCAVAEAEVAAAACRIPGAPRVVNLEPATLGEVLESLDVVATAAGSPAAGVAARARLQERIDAVAARSRRVAAPPRVMILEWIDPPFTAGHWSPEIVALAGGREVLGVAGEKSRACTWEEVLAADPEVIVVALCGFDVARSRRDLSTLAAMPGYHDLACTRAGRVFVVDGNAFFSRPGPRLVDALEILAHALHPGLHPLPAGLPAAERVEGGHTQG